MRTRLPLAPLPILPFAAAAPTSPRKPASASPRKPKSMPNPALHALPGPSSAPSSAAIFRHPLRPTPDALATLYDTNDDETISTPPRRLLDAFLQSAGKPELERSPSATRQAVEGSPSGSRSASPGGFVPRQPEDPMPFEIYEDEQDSSIIIQEPTCNDAVDEEDYSDYPKENTKPALRPLSIVTSTSRPVTPPPFENRLTPTSASAVALHHAISPPSSATTTSTPSSRFAETMSTFEGKLSRSSIGAGATLLPGFAIVESPPSRSKRPSLGEADLETREEKRMRRDEE